MHCMFLAWDHQRLLTPAFTKWHKEPNASWACIEYWSGDKQIKFSVASSFCDSIPLKKIVIKDANRNDLDLYQTLFFIYVKFDEMCSDPLSFDNSNALWIISLGEEHVGYCRLDFPRLKLSVVGGRPFSCGGNKIFRERCLSARLVGWLSTSWNFN